jgi:hypothetical protein
MRSFYSLRNVSSDERGHITISEALVQTRRHGVRFKPPKSRSSRRVLPVADELLSVLREHKAKQNAERLRLGPAYVDQDRFLQRRRLIVVA